MTDWDLWNHRVGYVTIPDYSVYLYCQADLFEIDDEINIINGNFRKQHGQISRERMNGTFHFTYGYNKVLYTNEKLPYHQHHVDEYNNYGLYFR